MGYSCTRLAGMAFDEAMRTLKAGSEERCSNVWSRGGKRYMVEIGREHRDGRITAQVWRFIADGRVTPAGSVRVSPTGEVLRFPTLTKAEREAASREAVKEYIRDVGFPRNLPDSHPGFVAIAGALAH